MSIKITAVIPTKNRPIDLMNAVLSVFEQKRIPDEFLIIDQSPGDDSKTGVNALALKFPNINLLYLHDTSITGLVHAKKVATEKASGDIVCFLEDDVVLEPEYLQQIEKGFLDQPNMIGCSGIITNPFPQPAVYNFIFHFFHRGIFRDKRLAVYGFYNGIGHDLISSDKISGGLSAWKKEVFKEIPFDPSNNYFMLEDIDFSTRVVSKFGAKLFINPNARLEHHWSPVNRDLMAVRQQKKMVESITFYKQRRTWPCAHLAMVWLLVGLFFEAIFKSFLTKSIEPFTHYLKGIKIGLDKSVTSFSK